MSKNKHKEGYLLGGVIGFIASLIFAFVIPNFLQSITSIAGIIVVIVISFCSIFSIVYIYRDKLIKKISHTLINSIYPGYKGVLNKGLDLSESIETGEINGAKANAKELFLLYIEYYSWINFRKWFIGIIIALIAIIGGLLTSFLVLEQTQELRTQNNLIRLESQLQHNDFIHSQNEMIIDKILLLIDSQINDTTKFIKNLELMASRLKLYDIIDNDETNRKISEEKGVLFYILYKKYNKSILFEKIISEIDFSNSHFQNYIFDSLTVKNLKIQNSIFDNIIFSNYKISNTDMENTIFDNVVFENGDTLNLVNLNNSILENTNFKNLNAENLTISSCSFINSRFTKSNFFNVNIYNSNLTNTDFSNDTLKNLSIEQSRLFGIDLNNAVTLDSIWIKRNAQYSNDGFNHIQDNYRVARYSPFKIKLRTEIERYGRTENN